MITRIFSVLLALFLAGTVGVFLVKVPEISFLSVVMILLTFLLMFTLGVYAGGRRIRIKNLKSRY
ncbi:MAG TPA: hypothetical protein VMG40_00445 [Bryobacteraceae bacterium]|nr:hypothetical protein [Bryobacteraceae bacterium]